MPFATIDLQGLLSLAFYTTIRDAIRSTLHTQLVDKNYDCCALSNCYTNYCFSQNAVFGAHSKEKRCHNFLTCDALHTQGNYSFANVSLSIVQWICSQSLFSRSSTNKLIFQIALSEIALSLRLMHNETQSMSRTKLTDF